MNQLHTDTDRRGDISTPHEDPGTGIVQAWLDDPIVRFRRLREGIAALGNEGLRGGDAAAADLVERMKGEVEQIKALRLFEDHLRLHNEFNTRGALERIAFHASLNQYVPYSYGEGEGVQRTLDALAQRPEFSAIVKKEADARQLVPDQVVFYARFLVSRVAEYPGGNNGTAVVVARDYPRYMCATLVAYLKLQDTWPHALKWREE